MKKILILPAILIFLLISGCRNGADTSETVDTVDNGAEEFLMRNETLAVYNISNELIGKINHYGTLIHTSDSIIYKEMSDDNKSVRYFRFYIDTKETIELGTVEDWSHETSEACQIDDRIYLSVTKNIFDAEERILCLYGIDLTNNTMSEITAEKGGFPYNAMAVAGEGLLVTKVLKNGSRLELFDPKNGETNSLIEYEFDDQALVGETIRQVSADETKISLLILEMQTKENVSLRIDTFDYAMNFLDSVDISLVSSEYSELRQGVGFFTVLDNYIYYENFSVTRFLGMMDEGAVVPIMVTDPEFELASDLETNPVTSLYFQSFSDDKNYLYLLDRETGKLSTATFHADDDRYWIIDVLRNQKEELLILMYYKDPETVEVLEPRAYYLQQSDLIFE